MYVLNDAVKNILLIYLSDIDVNSFDIIVGFVLDLNPDAISGPDMPSYFR